MIPLVQRAGRKEANSIIYVLRIAFDNCPFFIGFLKSFKIQSGFFFLFKIVFLVLILYNVLNL